MESISKRVAQLQKTRVRTAKIRRKTVQSLKSAKKLHRKSASTINSMQRSVSKIRSELDEISNGLQHSLAQKESIQRLHVYAEERLSQEKERKKEIEKELSSTTSDARDQLELTLDTISDQINEIRNEIRQRSSTGKKVDRLIGEYTTKKSRLSSRIKKTLASGPQARKIMYKSKKNIVKLEKRLPSLTKTEDNVKKNFSRINSIIREKAKERRKTKAKRKVSRKTKAKRKVSRKTKAKRKAPRKSNTKRKARRKRR